jgi:hypothetical protein
MTYSPTVRECYRGSDGKKTMALFDRLHFSGENGELAILLFRAIKASSRAKVYRGKSDTGESYRSLAYNKKGDTLKQLAEFLDNAGCGSSVFGWKIDEHAEHQNRWVFYVELSTGQVSFHSPTRHQGPTFDGSWDRSGESEERIIRFCEEVLEEGLSWP